MRDLTTPFKYYRWPRETFQPGDTDESFKKIAPGVFGHYRIFEAMLDDLIETQNEYRLCGRRFCIDPQQLSTLRSNAIEGCRELFASTLNQEQKQITVLWRWREKMQQLRIEVFTMEQIYETAKEETERLRQEVAAEHIAESEELRSEGADSEREPNVTIEETSVSGYGDDINALEFHSRRTSSSGGASSPSDNCSMGYLKADGRE